MNYAVKVHDGFDTLPPEWPNGSRDDAYGACYHAFQTKAFLGLWWETFGRSGTIRLCLVEVRDMQDRPLIFVPLCITSQRAVRQLTFIDAGTADYNAPILFPPAQPWTEELARDMWSATSSALPPHDIVEFTNMPASVGGLVNPLDLLADGPNAVFCHGTDLMRPWADIDRDVPQRKTLLKKMRGLERIAPVSFDVAATEAERRVIIGRLLEQKQRRFEDTKVPGFDADPAKQAFFQQGVETFAQHEMLHLCALRVGDTIVATAFGLTQATHYYGLMIGFESGEWASYSVGRILYYRISQWLHEQKFTFMDLGIGDEPWKLDHGDTTIPLSRMRRVLTPRGQAFDHWQKFLTRLRSTAIYQKLRPYKWVALRAIRRGRELVAREKRPS